MKLSATLCASIVALAAFALTAGGAGAKGGGGDPPICSKGFFKGDVSGTTTPPDAGSSFTCTTKVIECPAGAAVTLTITMSDQKATTLKNNRVQFSYHCAYYSTPK